MIVLTLSVPSLFHLHAQDEVFAFETVGMDTGLSQNHINCIAQDQTGFLWFGTQDGLNRYDGYQFKVFRHEPSEKNSISQNHIYDVTSDGKGGLWVATTGGLDHFDSDSLSFSHLPLEERRPGQSFSLGAMVLWAMDKRQLWIGTENGGLFVWEESKPDIVHYHHEAERKNTLNSNNVTAFLRDAQGRMWVGTDRGLNRFIDPERGFERISLAHAAEEDDMASQHVTTLLDCGSGGLLIGTQNGLCRFFPGNGRMIHYQHDLGSGDTLSVNQILALYRDSRGTIWVGSDGGGLNRFDLTKGTFISTQKGHEQDRGLNDSRVTDIFEDFSGVLWIGTQSGALNRLDLNRKQFGLVRENSAEMSGLSSQQIRSMAVGPKDDVWMGTDNGLNRLRPNQSGFDHYFTNEVTDNRVDNRIRAILEDNPSKIWVGTENKGLICFNPETGKSTQYRHRANDNTSLCSDTVRALIKTRSGQIWVGTSQGISILDGQNGVFKNHLPDPQHEGGLVNGFILFLYEDGQGRIWAGTLGGGLLCHRPGQEGFQLFPSNADDPSSFADSRILTMLERSQDNSGSFWVGTGGGLNYFHPQKGILRRYTIKEGLPNNVIYAILEDNDHRLWLSTNRGLSRFDIESGQFRNFGVRDGLQDYEFNIGASCKTAQGELFFGGVNGFNRFFPAKIIDNQVPPRLVLTDLRIFNESVPISNTNDAILTKSISRTDAIKLSYRHDVISLEFAALHYQFPSANRYAYMMEGLEDRWNEVGNRRFVTYTRIPPGEYVFHLRGCNSDGIWSETPLELKLLITLPFWKTFWFLSLASLVLGGLIVFLYKQRVSSLERKRAELEILVEARTSALEKSNFELEKLSIVARETDNAVIIMDGEGKIVWVNEGFARLYGEQPKDFMTKKGDTIFAASSNANIRELVQQCSETGTTIIYESLVNRSDGQVLWAQTTLTPIFDEQGKVTTLIAIDSDITKIKMAEIELIRKTRELEDANEETQNERRLAERANLAKSEFLARMSHEIRTPMNGVLGFAEMLLDSLETEEQRNFAQTIVSSGEALISLLNDILDFSKIEAGELSFELIDFDPEITAFDVCELIMPRINLDRVEIICHIAEDVPAYVRSDAGRFRQVLVNLMGNAAKFTDLGEIELNMAVEMETPDDIKLHVIIRDSGIGIAQDKLETIFELFQQADGSTTRKYGGTGLGLTICRQIAHLMGGQVWAESQLGQGSKFHFTTWVKKSDKKPDQEIDEQILVNRHILVVDDNANNLAILAYILRKAKARVIELSDPNQVLPLLQECQNQGDPIELCVLDIQMPEKNGFEVIHDVRKEAGPIGQTLIVAFSSSLKDRASRFNEHGFNGYLPKPVRRKRMISMIAQLLGERQGKEVDSQGPSAMITQHTVVEKVKHSAHILLAEDNPINQKLARFIFEKGGYNLTVVNNGEEAVREVVEHPGKYDLIFMDIQMPVMDGREATRRIHALGLTDTPIIAMTAESMKGDRELCIAAGMDDYISKPVKRETIYKMVRKWLLDRTVG